MMTSYPALLRIPTSAVTRTNFTSTTRSVLRAAVAKREFATDKYDRSKPHVNIGTIGHVDHGVSLVTVTSGYA